MKKQMLFALVLVFAACTLMAEDFVRTTMPLKRNGYNLFLQSVSSSASQPQKNLLMVHGMTYASHYFDLSYKDYSLMEFFAEKGYTVWRLDITGFGQSDPVEDGFLPTSDYAAEDIAAAVQAILQPCGAKQIDLLGWSWGTVTASKYAIKHPDQVRKLILYAPVVTGIFDKAITVNTPFVQDAWKGYRSDFQRDKNGALLEYFAETGLVDCYMESCKKYDKALIPNASRREVFSSKTNVLIGMENLKVPVLIIFGSFDKYLNTAMIYEKFHTLPRTSELIVINGGSHIVFLEKPFYHQFRNHLLAFLQSSQSCAMPPQKLKTSKVKNK